MFKTLLNTNTMPGSRSVSALIRSDSFKRDGRVRGSRKPQSAASRRYGWWGPGGWIPGPSPSTVYDFLASTGHGLKHGALASWYHGGSQFSKQLRGRAGARKQYQAELQAAKARLAAARAGLSLAAARENELLRELAPGVNIQEYVEEQEHGPAVTKAEKRRLKARRSFAKSLLPRTRPRVSRNAIFTYRHPYPGGETISPYTGNVIQYI